MELTRSLVEAKAAEYRAEEPLHAVEQQHLEIVPGTFAGDDYGWRDVEWLVQWYFRRHLGAYSNRERRTSEAAIRENDFGDVVEVLTAVTEADATDERLEGLTSLVGVDVPVASAFLTFMFPERYVVVGDREWRVLRAAGELDRPYPDPVTVDDYRAYLEVCRSLADRFEVDPWTVYRALWRLDEEASASESD
jgi:hypothetical protein